MKGSLMLRLFAHTMLCAAAAAPASASADPLSIITRVMVEQRRAAPDGTTRVVLASPDRVGPGERVVVVVTYRNTGAAPLSNIVLADSIAHSLAYVRPHAGTPEPELSTDGRHWSTLAELPRPIDARPAERIEVTAVRWRLSHPLAPGEAGDRAFDATVR